MVKIIVCMKIIIDPEIPVSLFKIDRESQKPEPPLGMPPVFSPFDENALESALKIKDQQKCNITILSMGKNLPKAVLQKALALGADEVIALDDPEFEGLDSFNTACALSNAIKRTGNYDLIFTGRQSADWDAGIVWAGISEILGLPSITTARRISFSNDKVIVEKCVCDGIEIFESEMPLLVTFTNDRNELRHVSLSELMKARRQEIKKWSASDIEFKKEIIMEICDLYEPDMRTIDCHFILGESLREKGKNLARKLIEMGIAV